MLNVGKQDRNRMYLAQKHQQYVHVDSTTTPIDVTSGALRTAKSRQKKTFWLFHMMPNNPTLKASALIAAIKEHSHRTKKCINDTLGVESPKTNVKRKLAMEAHIPHIQRHQKK